MEPQDDIFCYEKREEKCNNIKCLGVITIILLVSFAIVLGLIIGTTMSEAIFAALSAVIVLDVVLGLLTILSIILLICNRKKEKKHKCKGCY